MPQSPRPPGPRPPHDPDPAPRSTTFAGERGASGRATPPVRSILAAVELHDRTDAVLRAAAAVAEATGAALHLFHSAELWRPSRFPVEEGAGFEQRIHQAERVLAERVDELVAPTAAPASVKVSVDAPAGAILGRAGGVSADLIVLGAHRHGPTHAQFLGTTMDRVIRSARVPCLVVREPLRLPVRRIGVPTDLSPAALHALETALAWAPSLLEADDDGGATGEIRVMHMGSPPECAEDPAVVAMIDPELHGQIRRASARYGHAPGLEVVPDLLWGRHPARTIERWIDREAVDLLVMATHGRRGLSRALLGSISSEIARLAPCPVLLVPPTFVPERTPSRESPRTPRLEHIVVATDFGSEAAATARWVSRDLAPGASLTLAHVVPPVRPHPYEEDPYEAFVDRSRHGRQHAERRLVALRQSLDLPGASVEVREGSVAERLVRLAERGGADLLVVGERRSGGTLRHILGSTLERAIHLSSVPVLLARGPLDAPPRSILVGIDDSRVAERALRWARHIGVLLGAPVTVFHALGLVGSVPAPRPVSRRDLESAEDSHRSETVRWLAGKVRAAGFGEHPVDLRFAAGEPREELPEVAARMDAGLVVIGSSGPGAVRRALIGSVTGAILEATRGPVLVIPDRSVAGEEG